MEFFRRLAPCGKSERADISVNLDDVCRTLRAQLRYTHLPQLVGRPVWISSLKHLEADLLCAFEDDFPSLTGLWENDKNWKWGSDLFYFKKGRQFQVSLRLRDADFDSAADLSILEFINSRGELCVDDELTPGFWANMLKELSFEKDNSYLHLFLSHSDNPLEVWDQGQRSAEEVEETRTYEPQWKMKDQLQGTRMLCENIISKYFFPRNMFVLNAAITNIPSSMIWAGKYCYG